jgi:HEAT repeat protein
MTQFSGTLPLEQTFRFLVRYSRQGPAELIAYSVLHSTGDARRIAVSAALDRTERASLEAIVRVFGEIPADLQTAAIARADVFLPILRQNVRDPDHHVRSNACDFLIRMDDARVAYLFADLLQDAEEDIRKKAQEGLLSLANNYHTLVSCVERGSLSISKQALETKRYALLDALLTALRFYKNHERPEVIAALLSLDPRSDEVLMDILANPLDRRQRLILDILAKATYPRAASFILAMLKNPKTVALGVEILETRSDAAFGRLLMQAPPLFTNARIIASLAQVRIVPWLKNGGARGFPARLAVRAVRYLMATGASAEEKRITLEALAKVNNVALAAAAKFAISAQAHLVRQDRTDAGLVKIEERCPEMRDDEKALEVAGAAPHAGESMLLSDSELFRSFVNAFDTLARADRDAAISGFVSKGIFIRELRKMLGEADPEVVLRVVKVVEWQGCQADIATELSLLTRHPDARVRSSVVRQLGKAGAYDAVKALFDTLADRDRRVLANAIEGLEATGYKQVIRYLEPLLKHPDNRIRANAAKAAWTLGDESAKAVIVDMLKSQKADMRLSALWALRQMGARDEAAIIKDMVTADPDERVRKSAELTLADLESMA